MFCEITLSQISSFFLGLIAGVTLVFAIILIFISVSKKKSKLVGPRVEDITKEKMNELINNRQEEFVDLVENQEKSYFKAVLPVAYGLLKDIAAYYYPDSKYPIYELTVSEACELIHYIVSKVEEIFNKPVLKPLKQIKISFIAGTLDKAKKVKDNKVVKTALEVSDKGASEAISTANVVKNTLNPIYWFRKVVIKGTLNAAIKKICKAGLKIVGNEASKVYSKEAFSNVVDESESFSEFEEMQTEE